MAQAVDIVHHAEKLPFERLLTLDSVAVPCLIIGSVNAWNLWNEHWEHWEHLPPLEERTEYPYQNIRTKNYFWGDGDKVPKSIAGLVSFQMLTTDSDFIVSETSRFSKAILVA